jgi:hypothetical protein
MPIAFNSSDMAAMQQTWREINAYLPVWGVKRLISAEEVGFIVEEAYRAASGEYNVRAAQAWAGDYKFPRALLQRGIDDLSAAGGCLQQLCVNRHRDMYSSRLNIERVHSTFGADGGRIPGVQHSDFLLLLELASEGIKLLLPEAFRPIPEPPPLRNKYIVTASAVHKLLADQVLKGTVILLPTETARSIPDIHFSCQHWTENKGKPQGRIICDVANSPTAGEIPLNGLEKRGKELLRMQVEEFWGSIRHPTLPDIAQMVLRAAAEHGWDNIILWKMDLKGAFNLLWFKAAHTRYLAFPLTDGITVVHLAGMFGWVGMPFAFQVITRVVVALISFVILGLVLMYVDDVIGVSNLEAVESDMSAAHTAIVGLLGEDSVAISKNEKGRALDVIGWCVDLDEQTVTVSARNLHKTTHAFFNFDIESPVSRSQVERMASLASRVSQLCREMRPYTMALFMCLRDFKDSHTKRYIPALAKVDVCVWRAFLVSCRFDPVNISRPLSSYVPKDPSLCMGYDASLHTISVGVGTRDTARGTVRLRGFTIMPLPFPETNDSSYQNTVEFLAIVLGVLLAVHLGFRHRGVELQGDSKSSLQWAMKDRVKSVLARKANIAYTLTAAYADIVITKTTHVPGEINSTWDGATRGVTPEKLGLDMALQIHLLPDHPISEIIRLCNPQEPITSTTEHAVLSQSIVSLLHSPLMSIPSPPPTNPTRPTSSQSPSSIITPFDPVPRSVYPIPTKEKHKCVRFDEGQRGDSDGERL